VESETPLAHLEPDQYCAPLMRIWILGASLKWTFARSAGALFGILHTKKRASAVCWLVSFAGLAVTGKDVFDPAGRYPVK